MKLIELLKKFNYKCFYCHFYCHRTIDIKEVKSEQMIEVYKLLVDKLHPLSIKNNQPMNYLTENEIVKIEDSTAGASEQIIFRPSITPARVYERGLSFPLNASWIGDEFNPFLLQGARDVLKEIGPISKEDYDYYENL